MSDLEKANVQAGQLGLGGMGGATRFVPYKAQRETAIVAPAEMIAVGDAFAESKGKIYRHTTEAVGFNFLPVRYGGEIDSEKLAWRRHNTRANIAFCDGHVEGMRFNQLFAESDEAFQRWNADPPSGTQNPAVIPG